MSNIYPSNPKPSKKPSQFGGVPGMDGNIDQGQELRPHEEQRSLYQTDEANPTSAPKYGTGGDRVK